MRGHINGYPREGREIISFLSLLTKKEPQYVVELTEGTKDQPVNLEFEVVSLQTQGGKPNLRFTNPDLNHPPREKTIHLHLNLTLLSQPKSTKHNNPQTLSL